MPPFKKALTDLMPYVDYLFGNGGVSVMDSSLPNSYPLFCLSERCCRLLGSSCATRPRPAENEARAFAKSEGWETEDVEEIALRVRPLRSWHAAPAPSVG